VTSVSLLAEGASATAAAAALRAGPGARDVGVHLDLAGPALPAFLARAAAGLVEPSEVRARARAQVLRARSLGIAPTHVDAHRHAFLVPRVYRAVLSAAREEGVGAARLPRPLGALRCGPGLAGLAKGLVLAAAAPALGAHARAAGVATPDGIVDARVARRWVEAGRLPRSVRGRVVEVVAHPVAGDALDVPRAERAIDRARDGEALRGLREGLERLGARAVTFADLAASGGR
jgi:hypothetical protein